MNKTKSFPNQKCQKIWGFTHNVIVDFSIHRKRCVPVDVRDWLENDGEKDRQICLDIKVNYNGKKIGGKSLIWSQQKLSPELQREVHWWQVSHGRGSSFGNMWFRSSRGLGDGEASRGWRRRKKIMREMNSSSDGQNFSVADFWLLSFMRQCLHFLS